jgi:hypothetical protein
LDAKGELWHFPVTYIITMGCMRTDRGRKVFEVRNCVFNACFVDTDSPLNTPLVQGNTFASESPEVGQAEMR